MRIKSNDIITGINRAPQRAYLNALGLTKLDFKKPFIAVVNTWNEASLPNFHLKSIVESVKAGVLAGGGITAEASVADMPPGAFTWVPTPAGVCPMEMTMTKKTYEEIGGYLEAVRPLEEIRRDNPAIEISLATPSVIPRREGAE